MKHVRKNSNKGFTLIELIVVLVILTIFGGICGLVFKGCGAVNFIAGGNEYSSGTRIGVITKFSRKGTFNKSWEGEMLMGQSMTNTESGTAVATEKFAFSLTGEEHNAPMAQKIENAMLQGTRVGLKYNQVGLAGLKTDTPYIVSDVVPIGANHPAN